MRANSMFESWSCSSSASAAEKSARRNASRSAASRVSPFGPDSGLPNRDSDAWVTVEICDP